MAYLLLHLGFSRSSIRRTRVHSEVWVVSAPTSTLNSLLHTRPPPREPVPTSMLGRLPLSTVHSRCPHWDSRLFPTIHPCCSSSLCLLLILWGGGECVEITSETFHVPQTVYSFPRLVSLAGYKIPGWTWHHLNLQGTVPWLWLPSSGAGVRLQDI